MMTCTLRVCGVEDYSTLLPIIDDPETVFGLFADNKPHGLFYLSPPTDSGLGPTFVAISGEESRIVGGGRIEKDGFSYFVRKSDWKKGYGFNLARQMLEHFRSRRDSAVVLYIKRENFASARIAQRLGFRFAGLSGLNPAMLKFVIG